MTHPSSLTEAAGRAPGRLRHSIGLSQGVALYVSAILGAGVLVLPGQAASLAGPASLLAWVFSALLGIPLAVTFAALATRLPGAGGVATFASQAFGASAGGVVGWWYFIAGSVGQTIVSLTGGYYLAQALGVSAGWSYAFAGLILVIAVAANLAGLKISGRMQVTFAVGVALVLIIAAGSAAPHMRLSRLHHFAPHGLAGIGAAAVTLFFAFAGWEAITHLSGEFRNAKRDLRLATSITIAVVVALYLAIAAAVVLTGTYGDAHTDRLAIGLLLQHSFGVGAGAAIGIAALIISLGTTNAFIASVSRLGYSLAHDHWMPRPLIHLSSRQVPSTSIILVGLIGAAGLMLAWLERWGTQNIVAIPSTLVIVTYVVAMSSGVKLLPGRGRIAAATALVLTVGTLPFALGHILVPSGVAAVAIAYRHATQRRQRSSLRPQVGAPVPSAPPCSSASPGKTA